MLCPVDGETLVMTERSGVEIDYCPKCRGVWLDRGELDKIIARGEGAATAAAGGAGPVTLPEPGRDRRVDDHQSEGRRYRKDDDDDADRRHRGKRREGFLSELFDF